MTCFVHLRESAYENAHGSVHENVRGMPTKIEAGFLSNAPQDLHEDAHESAPSKFDSAHEHVHESVLGQISHVLFSHVLFLAPELVWGGRESSVSLWRYWRYYFMRRPL